MSDTAVIEQVGKRIDDLKEHFESMLVSFADQVKERDANTRVFIESVHKTQTDRQDNHGAQQRAGFEKVIKNQEIAARKHEDDFKELELKIDGIHRRTTALETDRNVITKIVAIFGLTGGAAGWGPHIKAWFQSLGKG